MNKQSNGGWLKSFPLFDIILIAVGLLLLLAPESAVTAALRIIGFSTVAYVIYRGYILLRFYRRDTVFVIILISQLFLLFIGAVLLLNPDGALRFLATVAGAYMVADGALKLYRAASTDEIKRKIIGAITSAASVILGFVLLLYPSDAVRLSGILIGASLVINALSSLISRFTVPRGKKGGDEDGDYIETEFVDKSDEL